MDFSLFKPNLINMKAHSATCSCSVELYKLWYTLEDFLPNWDISRGFLYISLILPFIYVPLPNRAQCEFNMNVYNTINSLMFI
jgi:hypothetical protein